MRQRLIVFSLAALMSFSFLTTKAESATLLGDYLNEKGIELEISASIDFYDKYIWRGFRLDGDAVLQPSVTLSIAGFEGGFWGSWDLESQDSLAGDEVDGWIGYGHDLGFIHENLEKLSFSVGHTWYDFPETSLYSKELYVGLSLDTFLSPYFTWYHDYADEANGGADGNYYMFGIGHSFTLNEEYGITLDLGQEIGLNNDAFIVGDGGYSLTSVGVTLPLTEKVSMAPTLAFSSPFGDLENSGQDDEFYGGVSFSFSM